MSGYSRMQAPPFWRGMFRIVGILCLVTLLTPSGYYLKYALVDAPRERGLARNLPLSLLVLNRPVTVDRVEYYARCAKDSPDSHLRGAGIQALGRLVALPGAQWKRPIDCLHAKLALSAAAHQERDPGVRQVAEETLRSVAARGAVIVR